MSIFKPLNKFLVKPHGEEYIREKNGIIVSASNESHKDVNRIGEVIATPIGYDGQISPGDLVILHHNVFRTYSDMKGYERKSNEYFKDNLYLVEKQKIYLVKKYNDWDSFDDYCFVIPREEEAKKSVSLGKYESNTGVISYDNKSLRDRGVAKGDLVGFTDDSEYEFEIDDTLMYRMKTKDICVKLN